MGGWPEWKESLKQIKNSTISTSSANSHADWYFLFLLSEEEALPELHHRFPGVDHKIFHIFPEPRKNRQKFVLCAANMLESIKCVKHFLGQHIIPAMLLWKHLNPRTVTLECGKHVIKLENVSRIRHFACLWRCHRETDTRNRRRDSHWQQLSLAYYVYYK